MALCSEVFPILSMPSDLPPVIIWLCCHTGFPGRRLAAGAERLVLFAAAAQVEEARVVRAEGKIERKNNAEDASKRQQAENRRKAHFKSNNRTTT
ncbi:MAG: hypothetical protein J6386_19495 [Candidatus Synoicihabitans palmerolidicus]|nr:hypothetical protein [Candidatus Synoicihabitans palmerolidicus]